MRHHMAMKHESMPFSIDLNPGEQVQFTQLWEANDRLGALTLVMGAHIDPADVEAHPDFATILAQPTAEDAYKMAKLVEELEGIVARG